MKKSVSILAVMLFGVMSAFPSNGAQMTSQIQRLLEQKEEKIKKLEECEGKKKGWMIAGLSTIGVTAVGVGVNIAQASKSNKLSGEIDAAKTELERQQNRLSEVEGQISAKEREKAERERAERERIEREQAERDAAQNGDGGGDNVVHGDYKDRKPDGKVGDICDNGKGIWATGGDKLCVDAGGNGLQECHCETKANYAVKGDNEFSVDGNGHGKSSVVDGGDTQRRQSKNTQREDGYCYKELNGNEYADICSVSQAGGWGANINQTTYNGVSKCSVVESSFGDIAAIDGSRSGMYCYCKLSSGQDWVNVEQTTSCETSCAYHCAYQFYSNQSFRNYFKGNGRVSKTQTVVKEYVDERNTKNEDGYCYRELNGNEYTDICSVNQPGGWGVMVNNKTYNGVAKCSSIESSFGDAAAVNGSGSGMYCYCKLSSGQKWINVEQTTSCETNCAYHCAYQFYSNQSFRNYF